MDSKSTPPPEPAPPPDPLGSGEFEAGATVKDLHFFQERKERLASALSILGSILASEHRPIVLTRLRLGTSVSPATGTGAKPAENGHSWIVSAALIGSILCVAAGLLFLLDAERPDKTVAWYLVGAAVILGIVAFAFLKKGRPARDTQKPSPGAGGQPADGAPSEADKLDVAFRETVKPLIAELRMTINLDDLESLLGELKAYDEYGRDLEDFHVTK
jgi:hypothetical protein